MGTHLSNKYSQKPFDTAKKSTTNAIKTPSKRAIQKIAEATGDLIGYKIADKITSVSKKTQKKKKWIRSRQSQSVGRTKKKIHISIRKTTNYWWIKVNVII